MKQYGKYNKNTNNYDVNYLKYKILYILYLHYECFMIMLNLLVITFVHFYYEFTAGISRTKLHEKYLTQKQYCWYLKYIYFLYSI